MSRIKNTLDSVSKAVATHADYIARVVKLKPTLNIAGKTPETNNQIKHENLETCTTPGTKLHCASETDLSKNDAIQISKTSKPPASDASLKQKPLKECRGTQEVKADLFHLSHLATNFGETYNFLATHINSYFGNKPVMDTEKSSSVEFKDGVNIKSDILKSGTSDKSDDVQDSASVLVITTEDSSAEKPKSTAPSTSVKKGIAHFFSYPTNSMQAFVDSYLGSLVPKLRHEATSCTDNKDKAPENKETEQKVEQGNVKDAKAVEDKAKRLSLQREKIIARVSVDNRTRALVQALRRASGVRLYISRVEELSYHLLEFPETRGVAVKEKVIPCLLRLRQASDETLQAAVRETLALIGYTDPVKGRGIRVLSIDGGGTRGLVALQTLRKLEDLTGKPIYQLFDYICGVSTGAILAFMLGLFHIPLDECEELYRKLGSDVFKQNVILGTVKMGWSHAFYDSEIWEKILKERMGSDLMIETARNPKCPKVSAVSTIVNRGTPLKAFVFRNYNHLPGIKSHYIGGCQYKLWQGIRASSAAPGFFQEYVLCNDLHQDGGLLINNPSSLALHECKCLWPDTPLQCLVSLGTGRYENIGKNNVTYTSLKAKLTNVISSATDTEEVHTMLDALLPPDTYFRFNPFMNEDTPLDESRKEKLNQLQMDALRYLEKNEGKLKKAAKILLQEKTSLQRVNEWLRLKADMYEGLPFFSKL
ncbi:calcium-independent phospholipase A2-gamma [Latimeria chalumnae]|uniref:calcium-independent phospholipase A2-gamma n=1 Tax=Latimeria chalumnae TaxID=7897 RepID=UPI0006D8F824|nr:PREDICTED: calcium-independent phospholipase A2-gamma [Latimeria chalumnae]|eukprot:XP_014349966.1 PREDICTED: calcium-independent phospholipase A2-gamma [Latimeria chalumnae]